MSKTLILCHIVFATKNRNKSITRGYERDLYAFLYDTIKQSKCWTYRINGMEDHIHILLDLNPTVSLSDLMKRIKWNSSKWLRGNPNFLRFNGWGEGYFAVSISPNERDGVVKYIMNQKEHHLKDSFMSEIETLVNAAELKWYPDDWE